MLIFYPPSRKREILFFFCVEFFAEWPAFDGIIWFDKNKSMWLVGGRVADGMLKHPSQKLKNT
jgi:hypothetical protein